MDKIWENLKIDFIHYLKGDSTVVSSLFGQVEKKLESFFYSKVNNPQDLKEIVQSSLLKIHLSRSQFDVNLDLKPWIFTIAYRTLIDHYRKYSRNEGRVDLAHEDIDSVMDNSDKISSEDYVSIKTFIKKNVNTLKPLDQSIVYLVVVEGFTMNEISKILYMSENSIKIRYHRAIKSLRKLSQAEVV